MNGPVDSLAFFDGLAAAMAADPERYERLGDIDLELAIVMRHPDAGAFRVQLSFHGITCDGVAEIAPGAECDADCWLDGPIGAWKAMVADIVEHGRATGEWTLNTLTLFGDRIVLDARDPMGADRFHRFNQTLQEFFDAAAHVGATA